MTEVSQGGSVSMSLKRRNGSIKEGAKWYAEPAKDFGGLYKVGLAGNPQGETHRSGSEHFALSLHLSQAEQEHLKQFEEWSRNGRGQVWVPRIDHKAEPVAKDGSSFNVCPG